MKAAVCTRYGPPGTVSLQDLPLPEPGPGEIRVRIRAATVSSGDARIRAARFPRGMGLMARAVLGVTGPRKPVLGTDLAGTVDALGPGVTGLAPGDRVMAFPGVGFFCHAEARVIRADQAVPLPAGLDFAEAASLPFGGTTALHYLALTAPAPGERLLVVGASGAVGVALVQIAKARGAHVTGLTSGANADLVRDLGADAVIDYRTADLLARGQTWDVVIDTVGTIRYASHAAILAPGGRLGLVVADLFQMIGAARAGRRAGHRVVAGPAPERVEDVRQIAALAAGGRLRPVIDARMPLDRIVAAHARVDSGRKRGALVIEP